MTGVNDGSNAAGFMDMTAAETTGPPAGGSNAWATLTDDDRRKLVQLAYRFLWDRGGAEDAVHDALLTARGKADQWRETGSWWAWLCRVLVRRCLLIRRDTRRRTARELATAAARSTRAGADPGRQEGHQEHSLVLRAALEELPPQQRIAVTLRYLEEMPYEQIAEVMELAPATVRVHVRRALEGLRASRSGRGVEP